MVFDPDFLYIESGFVKQMKPALGGAAAPNGDEGSYGEAPDKTLGELWEDANNCIYIYR